jgi:hypothetical protein
MRGARKGTGTAVAGITFGAAYIAGWALGVAGLPESFPPTADELVAYNEDHAGTAMAAGTLTALSVAALIWWVARLRLRLRDVEGGDGRLSDVAAGGGLVAAAVLLVASSAKFMPAIRADDQGGLDPAVATTMGDLHAHLAGAAAPLAFGLLVAATAALGFRHRLLPRWLSWLSALLGGALIVPVAPWIAIMAFPFWVIAVCIVLQRRPTATPALGPEGFTAQDDRPAPVAQQLS